jgi:hypothetical protein
VVVDRQGGVGVARLGDGLGQAHGQQDPPQTVGPPPLDHASAKQRCWHSEQRAEGHELGHEPIRRHPSGHRQPDRGQPQQPSQPARRPRDQDPDPRGRLPLPDLGRPSTVPLPHACSPPRPRCRCPTKVAPHRIDIVTALAASCGGTASARSVTAGQPRSSSLNRSSPVQHQPRLDARLCAERIVTCAGELVRQRPRSCTAACATEPATTSSPPGLHPNSTLLDTHRP